MGKISAIVLGIIAALVSGMWVRSWSTHDMLTIGGVTVWQDSGLIRLVREPSAANSYDRSAIPPGDRELYWWPPIEVVAPFAGANHVLLVCHWFLLLVLIPYPVWETSRWRRGKRTGRGFAVSHAENAA